MALLGDYYAEIGVRGVKDTLGAFDQVKGGLKGLASAATAPIRGLSGVLSGLASPVGLVGAALGAAGVAGVGGILKLASAVEGLETQFGVLLGSTGAAKKMMEDIDDFAAKTPFEPMELAAAGKQLLAYGVAAEGVVPTMRQLGDVSALSGARLADLVGIYGKVRGQGKLTAETLDQFQDRGIPIIAELARQFGVAETEIRDLVSTGRVGFGQVEAAIASMTSEGGKFAGGMEQLAKTTGGLWSTVTGNFKTLLANFGAGIIEVFSLKDVLAGLSDWIGSAAKRFNKDFMPAIQGFAATLRGVIGPVLSWLGSAFGELTGWVSSMWNEWSEVAYAWYDAMTAMFGMWYEMLSGIFAAAWEVAKWTWDTIAEYARNAFNAIGGYLFGFTEDSRIGFKDLIIGFYHQLQFFAENWKLHLAIMWERFKLFISNVPAYAKAAFTNMGILARWFADNWRDIMYTSVDYVLTIFTNLGKNIRALWQSVLDFFKTGRWEVDWTPLTDGFRNTIKEMPQLIKAEVARTTPALDALAKELERRREEFYGRKAEQKRARQAAREAIPGPEEGAPTGPGAGAGGPTGAAATTQAAATGAAAATRAAGGPGISFTGLAALANQMQEEAGKKIQEQAAASARQTAKATERLAGAVKSGRVQVEVAGATPAVYAP